MIYFLTYIILLWVLFAWYNADFTTGRNFHISGAVFSVYLTAGISVIGIYNPLDLFYWTECLMVAFIVLTARWIFFDIFYNIFTGQHWLYVGKTAWIDKTLGGWSLYIKGLFLFFSICFSHYLTT